MIFDEPVRESKVRQDGGPIKYIPGPLLDKKDITLYQHKDSVMVILDYDKKVNVDVMNEVLFRTIDGGASRKNEYVIVASKKQDLNRKTFRNVVDKILYSQDLRYDYMSSLPKDRLHNNVIDFKGTKELTENLYKSKYIKEGTLEWSLLSPIEQGCIIFEQFYGVDEELVSGKNINPEDWIESNRKVWLIVDRATNEERIKWMENFHKYKKMYDTFPVASLTVDGLPSDFPEEYEKINKYHADQVKQKLAKEAQEAEENGNKIKS
jgi:hypothetical protein